MDPAVVKSRIRHAEKERARREKSHTETLAYIRTKLFFAVEERALFIIVLGAVSYLSGTRRRLMSSTNSRQRRM